MFSFKTSEENINIIMKQLVIELKPRTAVSLLPGLPAYIIFMCVRHTDYINDEDKVGSLLSTFTNSVRKVLEKRFEDFETIVLWLSNTLRLVHTMKQYNGDKVVQRSNTPQQNDQSLRNFDLSQPRQLLKKNLAGLIYKGVMWNLREKVQPLIVPAILEHEDSPATKQKPINLLLQELTSHYKILILTLCGRHRRHNLSHFEMWTREKQLDSKPFNLRYTSRSTSESAPKKETSICEKCNALLERTYPVDLPFNPSNIHLKKIDIPEVLNLPLLEKKLFAKY